MLRIDTNQKIFRQTDKNWPEVQEEEIELWNKNKFKVGLERNSQVIWIPKNLFNNNQQKSLQAGDCCILHLLQKTGIIRGIKPASAYWAVVEKTKPHIDDQKGGIFRDSLMQLHCNFLEYIAKMHQDMTQEKTITSLPKSTIQIKGFEKDISVTEIHNFLTKLSDTPLTVEIIPNISTGIAVALLISTKASAAIRASTLAINTRTPLRIKSYPITITKSNDQIFLAKKYEKQKATEKINTPKPTLHPVTIISGLPENTTDHTIISAIEKAAEEKVKSYRRGKQTNDKTSAYAFAALSLAGAQRACEKATQIGDNSIKISIAKNQNLFFPRKNH